MYAKGPFPWGHVLGRLRGPLLVHGLVTVGVVALYMGLHPAGDSVSAASEWMTALGWTKPGVPVGAVAALGSVLAIFLGFRNSSAYDRWWEARKIWGAFVNDSRSWGRQVVAWCADEPTRKLLIHRQIAIVHGLGRHLRGQPVLEGLEDLLTESERTALATAPNILTALLAAQTKTVAVARAANHIEHFRHLHLETLLVRMSDIQGGCERIKNTPLPRQYDTIPRTFVSLYTVLLPFALAPDMGWFSLPIAFVVNGLLVLLEAAGRTIEDPFENQKTDIPMTALSRTIERDLRFMLGEPVPTPQPVDAGVLM